MYRPVFVREKANSQACLPFVVDFRFPQFPRVKAHRFQSPKQMAGHFGANVNASIRQLDKQRRLCSRKEDKETLLRHHHEGRLANRLQTFKQISSTGRPANQSAISRAPHQTAVSSKSLHHPQAFSALSGFQLQPSQRRRWPAWLWIYLIISRASPCLRVAMSWHCATVRVSSRCGRD